MFKYLEFKLYLSTYLFTDTNVPPLPVPEKLIETRLLAAAMYRRVMVLT